VDDKNSYICDRISKAGAELHEKYKDKFEFRLTRYNYIQLCRIKRYIPILKISEEVEIFDIEKYY
jgi:hypothetical protein